TWGRDPKIARLLEKRKKRGRRVPALDNRPELFDDLELVWQAFQELCHFRPSGWSYQAIPLEAIVAWMDLHEIYDLDERLFVYRMILCLDAKWVNHMRQRTEAEREAGKKGRRDGPASKASQHRHQRPRRNRGREAS